jgi:hypothetical protein
MSKACIIAYLKAWARPLCANGKKRKLSVRMNISDWSSNQVPQVGHKRQSFWLVTNRGIGLYEFRISTIYENCCYMVLDASFLPTFRWNVLPPSSWSKMINFIDVIWDFLQFSLKEIAFMLKYFHFEAHDWDTRFYVFNLAIKKTVILCRIGVLLSILYALYVCLLVMCSL